VQRHVSHGTASKAKSGHEKDACTVSNILDDLSGSEQADDCLARAIPYHTVHWRTRVSAAGRRRALACLDPAKIRPAELAATSASNQQPPCAATFAMPRRPPRPPLLAVLSCVGIAALLLCTSSVWRRMGLLPDARSGLHGLGTSRCAHLHVFLPSLHATRRIQNAQGNAHLETDLEVP